MNYHGGDIYQYDKELLDFSSNINPFGVPDSFRGLLIKNINDFTKYPDIRYTKLRESIIEYLNIDSIEHTVVGNGAVEVIYKAIDVLEIDNVIILAPTFSEYRRAVEFKGVRCDEIQAYDDRGKLLVGEVMAAIKPNSLMVICNPNNPTGTLTNTEYLSQIAMKLSDLDSYLVLDEAFIEFTDNYPNTSMISKISEHLNMIVVRAATKFFGMPGIRLGYGVCGDCDLIRKIENKLEPWNINTAAVIAGSNIFTDEDYISRSRKWIREERNFLYRGLQSVEGLYVYPSEANFFLCKLLKNNMNGNKLKELMADKGVLIRTSEGFTHLDPYHIRLAVKDRHSNIKMLNALKGCMDI